MINADQCRMCLGDTTVMETRLDGQSGFVRRRRACVRCRVRHTTYEIAVEPTLERKAEAPTIVALTPFEQDVLTLIRVTSIARHQRTR